MTHFDISIVIPGIRPSHWLKVFQSIQASSGYCKTQVIFVGPKGLPPELEAEPNVTYIKDMGSPSRCFQMGALLAEGKYLGLGVDDGLCHEPLGIQKTFEALTSENFKANPCQIAILKYIEGGINLGPTQEQHFHDAYWTAGFHEPLANCSQVKKEWKWGLPLMKTEEYHWLGGIDCKFEHINMNLHDLMFRAQAAGWEVLAPPFFVYTTYFETGRSHTEDPVLAAFFQNDEALFKQIYNKPGRTTKISYDSWREAERVWKRRIK